MTHDVTKAIQPKSDQLNADSLMTGPMTIRIRDVKVSDGEQPIWVHFDNDDNKPWKPCKTSARCLAAIWGPNAAQWVGLHVTLYNDPTVTWGGAAVGGIRVSHMEGIDKPVQLNLTKTRGKKGIVTIQPLKIEGANVSAPEFDHDAALKSARDAASKGKALFDAWWKENADKRDAAKSILDELKQLVSVADAPVDDDEVPL